MRTDIFKKDKVDEKYVKDLSEHGAEYIMDKLDDISPPFAMEDFMNDLKKQEDVDFMCSICSLVNGYTFQFDNLRKVFDPHVDWVVFSFKELCYIAISDDDIPLFYSDYIDKKDFNKWLKKQKSTINTDEESLLNSIEEELK